MLREENFDSILIRNFEKNVEFEIILSDCGKRIKTIRNLKIFFDFLKKIEFLPRVLDAKKFLEAVVSKTVNELEELALKMKSSPEDESCLIWMVQKFSFHLVENKNHITESHEIYFIIRFLHFLHTLHLLDASAYMNLWPQFDLPPGIGKTFQMKNIFSLFDDKKEPGKKCTICCPTAKASLLYDTASTVHSKFCIAPDLTNFKGVDDCVLGSLADCKYFIIDEFSMIPGQILDKVLQQLYELKKFLVVAGDSCQFNPVRAKPFNFEKFRAKFVRDEFGNETLAGFLVFFECPSHEISKYDVENDDSRSGFKCENKRIAEPLILPNLRRFEGSLKERHIEFVMCVRSLIKFDRSLGTKNKPYTRFSLNAPSLEFWASFFKELFTVSEEKITKEMIFDKQMVDVQKNTLKTLTKFKFDLNLFLQSGETKIKIENPELKFERLPLALSYYNNTAVDFQNEMYQKLQKEFFLCEENAKVNDSKEDQSLEKIPLCTVFLKKRSLQYNYNDVVGLLNGLPGNVSSADNILKIGSYVICRRNDKQAGDYNGLQGIVFGQKIVCKKRCKFRVERIDISKSKRCCAVSVEPEDEKDFDISHDLHVYLFVFDIDENAIRVSTAKNTILCKNCEAKNCMIHSTPEISKVLYWHTMYSVTLHNLQGATLSKNGTIYCLTDQVLATNRLTAMYILLSRPAYSKDIVMDKFFIFVCLRSIFGEKCIESVFAEKIRKILNAFPGDQTKVLEEVSRQVLDSISAAKRKKEGDRQQTTRKKLKNDA